MAGTFALNYTARALPFRRGTPTIESWYVPGMTLACLLHVHTKTKHGFNGLSSPQNRPVKGR